jgi:hypothetical protein
MKKRIETVTEGVTSEVISLLTTLVYDPASKDVKIVFGGVPCLYANDQYIGPGGDPAPIAVSLSDIASRCLSTDTDPVTQAELSNISAAGVVMIIKAAFAVLYDERANAAPPVADAYVPPSPDSDEPAA